MVKVSEVDWHGRGNRRFDLPGEVEVDERVNPREVIGGNNPPVETKLSLAATALRMMTVFLNDHPVVSDGKAAEAAAIQIKNARANLADMEDERDAKVRPLNEQVAEINGDYKAVGTPFKRVLDQVRERLTQYTLKVERERERVAEITRAAAQKLIDDAREKERLEQEAIANAKVGEADAGIAEKIVEADAAFAAAKRAVRQANVAERDATVRVAGGGGRALGLRTTTTITLVSAVEAITDMKRVSEKVSEAILSDARAFYKLNKRWPAGVTAAETRGI